MTVTYGFYNSVGGDRAYNALQMGSIFDGIIKDGIYAAIGTALVVTPIAGRNVQIGIGRAWFNHTWTLNDAVLSMPIDAPDLVNRRIDVVVLEINAGDGVRTNSFKIVKGTPAASPAAPALTNNSTVHQYPLAHVSVPVGITTFTASHITNKVGTAACPYVTGVLTGISNDAIVANWESQFAIWFAAIQSSTDDSIADLEADFMAWFTAMQGQLTVDAAGNLQTQITSKVNAIKTQSLADWGMGFSANPPVISRFPPFNALMQVGADYVHGAGAGEVVVTFPTPFSGWPLIFVSALPINSPASNVTFCIKAVSETGFTAKAFYHTTIAPYHSDPGLTTLNWLAIGPA